MKSFDNFRLGLKEGYDKTNKASITIKNGYDEGDGPDNKKLVKYIAKKAGAVVKLGKNGTMVITGSDEQIHKALQLHYSDDKKGLGDLDYHKTGKTSSDDHVKGMFSYKAESTSEEYCKMVNILIHNGDTNVDHEKFCCCKDPVVLTVHLTGIG